MFSKLIKRKSIQSILKKNKFKPQPTQTGHKIMSVGIILNIDEQIDLDELVKKIKTLFKDCQSVQLATFSFEKLTNKQENYYDFSDLSLFGKVTSQPLKAFINSNFDLLINYHLKSNELLYLISAMSNSKFTLGFNPKDIKYNDLILDIKLLDFAFFKEESKKYLSKFLKF